MLEATINDSVDYMSNILSNSFPIGLHIEIFTKEALSSAYINAFKKDEREHVTILYLQQ